MGLFGDLDVASAEDNPWFVPANTYEMDVYKVELKPGKDDKDPGLLFTYKISSGEHEGKQVTEFKRIPQSQLTKEDKDAASYLKMRLASLGVPESKMNSVEPEDLQGLAVIVTVKQNGEYTNVNKVELASAGKPQEFTGFGG